MIHRFSTRLLARALAAGAFMASSAVLATGNYTADHPAVEPFVEEMRLEYGFDPQHVRNLLAEAEHKDAIIQAISRPAERVRPWHEYRKIFITDKRIADGVSFWNRHADILDRAEEVYGVEPEVILAIIGVETAYGANKGSWRVIDALTTLGFDYAPRADFFRRQLKSFLVLTREQQVDPLKLTGSYAGAMGYPQFIPSSYQAYAVDFDGDGLRDIWDNPADAIGSAANYFAEHTWRHGETVAVQASVSGDRYAEGFTLDRGLEAKISVGELKALGWKPQQELDDDLQVMAFEFDAGEHKEYWLGLNNLHVITRYNRSVMYAMVVHQLADLIREARDE